LITQFITPQSIQSSLTLNNVDVNIHNVGNRGFSILMSIIDWAKSNPHFPSLAVNDQLALIKMSWKEIFILHLIESNFTIPLASLARTENFAKYPNSNDYIKSLQINMNTLSSFQMDSAELACLKAMLLFTSGK